MNPITGRAIFVIFIVFFMTSSGHAIKYKLKRYPLFAATPTEFAKVVETNGQNIVFNPQKNRQFCAIQIDWFDSSNKVSCLFV